MQLSLEPRSAGSDTLHEVAFSFLSSPPPLQFIVTKQVISETRLMIFELLTISNKSDHFQQFQYNPPWTNFSDQNRQLADSVPCMAVLAAVLRRRQWHPTPVLFPGKFPGTEEPGRLQSTGSLRVWHDWATSRSLFTFIHWRRKWQPTHVLAWRIPGMGEPGGLPMGWHRVGHNWSNLAAAEASLINNTLKK